VPRGGRHSVDENRYRLSVISLGSLTAFLISFLETLPCTKTNSKMFREGKKFYKRIDVKLKRIDPKNKKRDEIYFLETLENIH
jgi:hypothetical protein